jgi:hypothetical protein
MTPKISIIIAAYNAAATLDRCLRAIAAAHAAGAECIVADDGSADGTPAIAREFGVKVLTAANGPRGPAYARNLAAREAAGEILWFIDADVCAHDDAGARIATHFDADPDLAAVIGAYDDAPDDPAFLSQYRNLMHSFYHHAGGGVAYTFWAGCGAIRRAVFLAHGGFSLAYRRPSIEDIELGYRLTEAGCRLRLDPSIQGTHLKRWTFLNMVRTDVFDRALPWTELILRHRSMPNHLNLQWAQRISVVLVGLGFVLAVAASICDGAWVLLPLATATTIATARYWIDPGAPRPAARLLAGGLVLAAFAALASARDLGPPVFPTLALLGFLASGLLPVAARRWHAPACVAVQLVAIVAILWHLPRDPFVIAAAVTISAVVGVNWRFYRFIGARRGWSLAIAAIPFHLFYFLYGGVAFSLGLLRHFGRRSAAPSDPVEHEQRD